MTGLDRTRAEYFRRTGIIAAGLATILIFQMACAAQTNFYEKYKHYSNYWNPPPGEPSGTVILGQEVQGSVWLKNAEGQGGVVLHFPLMTGTDPDTDTALAPPGTYLPVAYSFYIRDKADRSWRAKAGLKKSEHLIVESGKATRLKVGPPFRVYPTGVRFKKKTGELKIKSYTVIGQGGETCENHQDLESKLPAIEVLNSDGEVFHRGNFEYG